VRAPASVLRLSTVISPCFPTVRSRRPFLPVGREGTQGKVQNLGLHLLFVQTTRGSRISNFVPSMSRAFREHFWYKCPVASTTAYAPTVNYFLHNQQRLCIHSLQEGTNNAHGPLLLLLLCATLSCFFYS
jgi:hypothetical protein